MLGGHAFPISGSDGLVVSAWQRDLRGRGTQAGIRSKAVSCQRRDFPPDNFDRGRIVH